MIATFLSIMIHKKWKTYAFYQVRHRHPLTCWVAFGPVRLERQVLKVLKIVAAAYQIQGASLYFIEISSDAFYDPNICDVGQVANRIYVMYVAIYFVC